MIVCVCEREKDERVLLSELGRRSSGFQKPEREVG